LTNNKYPALSLPIGVSFLLFLSLFILSGVLFFANNHGVDHIIFAQFQNNMSSLPLPGVNITSPQKAQQIPINISELNISGKSTDRPAIDDCQVSVIVNDVKPYQPATANGTTGENNDYSKWSFLLNSNYTSIKQGVNKITAKLSCLPDIVGNNITKWYSINVTGIATTERNNSTPIPPPQPSPAIDPNIQLESKSSEPRRLDSDSNEEREPPISDTNDKIGEEIDNLKDRIMEQVEENLRDKGIEVNLR
jgi:hypothetical protein